MSISRYTFNNIVKEGKIIGTSTSMSRIFYAVDNGAIQCSTYILEESQRLDHLAGLAYQNSSYWWVIAAASGIGWSLQVPPGTYIRIPNNIDKVLEVIS